jgi:transposase
MGTRRACAAADCYVAQGWTTARRQSRSVDGDLVRVTNRNSLDDAAAGVGLRLWNDLLASIEGLARGRGVGPAARSIAGRAQRRRPDRLVASGGRQLQHPSRAGGTKTGPNPTDRGKAGSKHHVITDAAGIPLATTLTGANAHDVTQLLPLVEAIPAIGGKRGRPRRRPKRVQGDRGYDSQPHRDELRRRGIASNLARRNTEHGSGLGKTRWVVERTIAWLHQFRRLRIRYERRDDIHQAIMAIGCALICFNYLNL